MAKGGEGRLQRQNAGPRIAPRPSECALGPGPADQTSAGSWPCWLRAAAAQSAPDFDVGGREAEAVGPLGDRHHSSLRWRVKRSM